MSTGRTVYRRQTICSKVTVEEYRILLERAKAQDISLSEYVRLSTLSTPEAHSSESLLRELFAEVRAVRTIVAYTVANLSAGQKIDAKFINELFAEADAVKEHEAKATLARARLRTFEGR